MILRQPPTTSLPDISCILSRQIARMSQQDIAYNCSLQYFHNILVGNWSVLWFQDVTKSDGTS
jgi:hypothetical protein